MSLFVKETRIRRKITSRPTWNGSGRQPDKNSADGVILSNYSIRRPIKPKQHQPMYGQTMHLYWSPTYTQKTAVSSILRNTNMYQSQILEHIAIAYIIKLQFTSCMCVCGMVIELLVIDVSSSNGSC